MALAWRALVPVYVIYQHTFTIHDSRLVVGVHGGRQSVPFSTLVHVDIYYFKSREIHDLKRTTPPRR